MSLLEAKIHSVVYDEVYTPRHAVDPILKYVKPDSIVWCPFDTKESNYVIMLQELGYKVIYSHKDDNKDFFTYEPDNYDIIISNPPYSIKDDILTRLYELGKPFAMLLPITTLEGKYRNTLYKKYGLEILVLNKRINFLGQKKNNYFNTSYFCYKVLPQQLVFAEVLK